MLLLELELWTLVTVHQHTPGSSCALPWLNTSVTLLLLVRLLNSHFCAPVSVCVRCMCDLGANVVISLLATTSVLLPLGTTWRSTDFARQDKTNTAQIKHIEHRHKQMFV